MNTCIHMYGYVHYTFFLCGAPHTACRQETSLKSSHCELRWKSVKKAKIVIPHT